MSVIDAVVVDCDWTMWKRSTTEALGRGYLAKAVRDLKLYKAANYAFGIDYYVGIDIPVFLSTMAGSTTADYARYNFRLTDTVSNAEIFDNSGKFIGFGVRITCGESKLALTEEVLDTCYLLSP